MATTEQNEDKQKFIRRRRSTISMSDFDNDAQRLIDNWETLSRQLDSFEQKHRTYLSKMEEVEALKTAHRSEFDTIKKQIDKLKKQIDVHKSLIVIPDNELTLQKKEEKAELLRIRRESEKNFETPEKRALRLATIREQLIAQRSDYLKRITYTLPQAPERYLRIILGSELPVSILNKADQWRYKESYEQFKVRVILVIMIVSLLMSTIIPANRALDALFHFLLVWYYCTLTIRESILVVNGSKIQFWWRLHHFITTIGTCIILIWPSTHSYKLFRQQHYIFNLYISFVQLLQYYYQKGLLYRLRALGDSDELQVTIEGFQSFMLRGLSFLVPFLFLGYLFQLYNAFILYQLSITPGSEPNPDWQFMLKILSGISLTLFLGNFITMYIVIRRKIRERVRDIQWLKHRYESIRSLLHRVRSGRNLNQQ